MAIALALGPDGRTLVQLTDLEVKSIERSGAGPLVLGSALGALDELKLGSVANVTRVVGDVAVDGQLEQDLDLGGQALVSGGTRVLVYNGTAVYVGEPSTPGVAVVADVATAVLISGVERVRVDQNGLHIKSGAQTLPSAYQINGGAPVTSPFAVDFANGQFQTVVLGASTSIASMAASGPGLYWLEVRQDGAGNRTLTWPGYITAPGGKATGLVLSTSPNARDQVTLTWNGLSAKATVERDFLP